LISYDFTPRRVCSRKIHVELSDDGNTIERVEFTGGCDGNTKAVAKLVQGQPVEKVIDLLAGNDCVGRGTSCADQMTIALAQARAIAQASA